MTAIPAKVAPWESEIVIYALYRDASDAAYIGRELYAGILEFSMISSSMSYVKRKPVPLEGLIPAGIRIWHAGANMLFEQLIEED